MPFKLGKAPATHDDRDLSYDKYLMAAAAPLTPPPTDSGNLNKVAVWEMLGNGPDTSVSPDFDGAGDCVFAGGDHETMLWLTEAGVAIIGKFDGTTALADYSAVTGYRQDDPDTDRGTNVRTALNYRRKTGLVDKQGKRHKLAGYVRLEPGNKSHVKEAIHLFDAVGIGIAFPDSAMDQFNNDQPWAVVPGPTPTEGHYIPLIGYDTKYLYCVTWGKVQKMTWEFFEKYCDEAWALLSQEFLTQGKSSDGFNFDQLKKDLQALSH
jgi:hypothetical protein